MESVKKYSFSQLSKLLSGKQVHFKSDCEFFPNFDVKGKVMNTVVRGPELMFKFKTGGKVITIGSNMKNLRFELIKKGSN